MMSETLTDRLAEIEGQPEPQPVQVREGRWRTRNGEIRHVTRTPDDLSDEGRYLWHDAEHCQTWYDNGRYFHEKEHPLDLREYLGPIEPEPDRIITPDDVAAEALAEPQPVQIREGRWRTRGGEIRNVILTPAEDLRAITYPWHDARYGQTWLLSGRYDTDLLESPLDLWEYLGPVQPEPEAEPEPQPEPQPVQVREGRWRTRAGSVRNIVACPEDHENYNAEYPWSDGWGNTWANDGRWTDRPSSMDLLEYVGPIEPEPEPEPEPQPQPQSVHLQAMVDSQAETIARLNSEIHGLNMEIGGLQTQLEAVKAESAKRLQQVEELRSEVSHVQRLLGDERRRFTELETLASDLRAVNAATESAVVAGYRQHSDVKSRKISELNQQLEAVKAELSQERLERNQWQNQVLRVTAKLEDKTSECRNLRIELDALQQAPQAETVAAAEAVSDRWEEGWDDGTARAVETIAEWTAPFRACGSQALAYHVMQNLPHIMRSLTGLADED